MKVDNLSAHHGRPINWAMDTRESANFARIACLTIQEGTERIRTKTLANLSGDRTFQELLAAKDGLFKGLRNKGIISKTQYDILYPNTDDVHLSNIDMTLWMILARNLASGRKYIRWTEYPDDKSYMWQHDAIRLKEARNKLFHLKTPELTNQEFEDFKREVVGALRRLGSKDDVIQDYFSRDLDPEQTKACCLQVREQCLDEMQLVWLASMRHKHQMKNVAIILAVLTAVVAAAFVIPMALIFSRTPPCANAIVEIFSASGTLRYMSRASWGALPRRDVKKHPMPLLPKPVNKAVVFNTELVGKCDVTRRCCTTIRNMQQTMYESKRVHWQDIAYNFLIGEDGVVYEGRGAHYMGAAAWHHNSDIVSIGFLGNFICTPPSREAIMALYVFLEYIQTADPSTESNRTVPILAEDYRLFGHCQINKQTPEHNISFADSPGASLMREINTWDRMSRDNLSHCRLDVDCMRPVGCCRPCTTPYTPINITEESAPFPTN